MSRHTNSAKKALRKTNRVRRLTTLTKMERVLDYVESGASMGWLRPSQLAHFGLIHKSAGKLAAIPAEHAEMVAKGMEPIVERGQIVGWADIVPDVANITPEQLEADKALMKEYMRGPVVPDVIKVDASALSEEDVARIQSKLDSRTAERVRFVINPPPEAEPDAVMVGIKPSPLSDDAAARIQDFLDNAKPAKSLWGGDGWSLDSDQVDARLDEIKAGVSKSKLGFDPRALDKAHKLLKERCQAEFKNGKWMAT